MSVVHHPSPPRHPLVLLASAAVVILAVREGRAMVHRPPFTTPA
jgi:hypothetical protein